MSVMTYTCSQCGDTGRDVLEVVNDENYCEPCLGEESKWDRKVHDDTECEEEINA